MPVQIVDASNLWRRSMGNMVSVWPLQELEKGVQPCDQSIVFTELRS